MEDEKVVELQPNGGYPMHTFEDVREIFATYISSDEDRKLVKKAYKFAKEQHAGVFRRSGEPYIQHPIEVAYICASLQSGPETLCAAFLHDVVEDTDTTVEDIENGFNEDVAFLVDSLTKIQRMKLSKRTEQDFEAEDHRKIFLGMAKDFRVIIVKLADRLHNMRTLDALKPERQLALSKETLEVFTPIAHRLGIYTIQSELEDLCLKYLEPEKYAKILHLLDEKERNRQDSLEKLKKRIADILFEKNIPFRIESRVKSIYSIYRKMYQKGYTFDEVYDVLAVRVITESEINCYEILGIVHAVYKPVPGRFKDYIAMPKPNMYQSLHTTILSGDGNIYEVQIRTEKMDQIAETGIAAHWVYKEGNRSVKDQQKDIEQKLHWFRDFVSISDENDDAKTYMANLSNDIFNANVYVFTPLGKVIDLPQGATIIDFAYKIHTKVAESAVGANVNGQFVPLNTELHTGDVCEIKTSKTAPGPNPGWLQMVVTNGAKSKIRKYISVQNEDIMADELIRRGKDTLSDVFRSYGYDDSQMEEKIGKDNVLKEYKAENINDIYKLVANKIYSPSSIIDFCGCRKLKKPISYNHNIKIDESTDPVEISGGCTNIALNLARCCSPVPGDDIVGYITRGKGVSVHRKECPNVRNETKRLLDVSWKENIEKKAHPVNIEVYANDRVNLLGDILGVLASRNIPVSQIRAHLINATMNDVVSITIYVPDKKTITDAFADLKSIKGVYDCKRKFN